MPISANTVCSAAVAASAAPIEIASGRLGSRKVQIATDAVKEASMLQRPRWADNPPGTILLGEKEQLSPAITRALKTNFKNTFRKGRGLLCVMLDWPFIKQFTRDKETVKKLKFAACTGMGTVNTPVISKSEAQAHGINIRSHTELPSRLGLYVRNPYNDREYLPLGSSEKIICNDRVNAFKQLLISMGATEYSIEVSEGSSSGYSGNGEVNIPVEGVNLGVENQSSQQHSSMVVSSYKSDVSNADQVVSDDLLSRLDNDSDLKTIYLAAKNKGVREITDCFELRSTSKTLMSAAAKYKSFGVELGGDSLSTDNKTIKVKAKFAIKPSSVAVTPPLSDSALNRVYAAFSNTLRG